MNFNVLFKTVLSLMIIRSHGCRQLGAVA